MARIKINIPDNIIDTLSIPVRITDINYGNHVGNDALVSIVHEARVKWLRKHELTELNVGGCGLIMGDLAVEYLAESFYGDVLNISLSCAEISKVSFELFYEIETKRMEKKILIARAKTGMICFDYDKKKIKAIPPGFRDILSPL